MFPPLCDGAPAQHFVSRVNDLENMTKSSITNALLTTFGVKLLSFLVSVLTVRYSSISDFGKISVQYQLYVSLPLFLMKEGFRRAAIRETNVDSAKAISAFGTWITMMLVVLSALIVIRKYEEDITTISLITFGLLIETVSEQFLIHHLIVLKNFATKTVAETWASFFRSIALLLFLYLNYSPGIAFGLSQIVYGLIWSISLARSLPIWPTIVSSIKDTIKPVDVNKMFEMSLSAIQKLLLTEGERIIAVSILDAEALGHLGLITNLGSMVLRLFFAPIEDIAFTGLAQTKKISDRLRIIQAIFGIEFIVGLMGIGWGPLVAQSVIQILYGHSWSSNPQVVSLLQIYCLFLFLCSANGPLEAYYFAVADSRKIRYSMVSQSIAFAAFAILTVVGTTKWGIPGSTAIVLGNSVSMLIRIFWSFTSFPTWRDIVHPLLPGIIFRVICGTLIAWIITHLSQPSSLISGLIISGSTALVTGTSMIKIFPKLLHDAKNV